jgi:hypothetical protein
MAPRWLTKPKYLQQLEAEGKIPVTPDPVAETVAESPVEQLTEISAPETKVQEKGTAEFPYDLDLTQINQDRLVRAFYRIIMNQAQGLAGIPGKREIGLIFNMNAEDTDALWIKIRDYINKPR